MLYISTRSKIDSFTAYRALHENCAPDGGAFAPMQLRKFGSDEIELLLRSSFNDAVSTILNYFFSTKLSGFDLDFSIGRMSAILQDAGHKTVVAELWHNLTSSYSCYEKSVMELLGVTENPYSNWSRTAIACATLFGLFALAHKDGYTGLDVAISAEDMIFACGARYAKQMGLPVGKIICVCSENNPVWDLVQRGEIVNTALSQMKNKDLPISLERLMYLALGREESAFFTNALNTKRSYSISEDLLPIAFGDMYSVVVGESRVPDVINSVNRSCGYAISKDAAFTFGGLQDYRARTGASCETLLLSMEKPGK